MRSRCLLHSHIDLNNLVFVVLLRQESTWHNFSSEALQLSAAALTNAVLAAVFNENYLKWVEENIHEIDYLRKARAMSLKWDGIVEIDVEQQPVVVMVTQVTVSRYYVSTGTGMYAFDLRCRDVRAAVVVW